MRRDVERKEERKKEQFGRKCPAEVKSNEGVYLYTVQHKNFLTKYSTEFILTDGHCLVDCLSLYTCEHCKGLKNIDGLNFLKL